MCGPFAPSAVPLPESCGWGSSEESSAEAGTLPGRACWGRGVAWKGPTVSDFHLAAKFGSSLSPVTWS